VRPSGLTSGRRAALTPRAGGGTAAAARRRRAAPGRPAPGTALSTSVFLATGASGNPALILPGHRRFEFAYNGSTGAYENTRDPEMLGAKITQGPGQYGLAGTLTLRNGDQWQFNNQGDCTAELDRHNNFLNIDGAPFTQAVRYGGWITLRFAWVPAPGRISATRTGW
jgi:hypothetical protein